MIATINAHQLGRLIDKTISHIGGEYTESLHGVRLETDTTHLYAIATDRYTLAVARFPLYDDTQTSTPDARTIPAEYLRTLTEWINTQVGHASITIATDENRLVFTTPHSEMRIAVQPNLEFPNWRGILRGIVQQTADSEPFPALNLGFTSRFANAGDNLRVRIAAEHKAVLVFGECFIGAQMPARYAGVGPVKDETFESATELWQAALGDRDAIDMTAAMPSEDGHPRYEVTTDVRETGEELLRQTLRSCSDMAGKSTDKPEEFLALAMAGINAWSAYRFLDALYTADPRLAAATVAEVAGQLDSGEIGEFAWDAAEKSGYDPQKWHDDYEAHLKTLAEKKASATA